MRHCIPAHKVVFLAALCTVPLCTVPLCWAQPSVIVDKALAYHQQKDWNRAFEVLRDGSNACPAQPEPEDCRLLMQYSIAYTYEQQAAAEPQIGKQLLARAVAIYSDIHKQVPAHSPTINNLLLIYRRLGETAQAEALVADAVQADARNADRYRLMLADIYESAGEAGRARDSLLQALDQSESADLRVRLVSLLRNEPQPNLQRIFDLGRRWEPSSALAARAAFEAVVLRGYEANSALAEQALVRWVLLLARTNNLSVASLRSLPMKWNSAAVEHLRAFLNNPWVPIAENNWWRDRSHPDRSLALASAALSLGGQTLASGQNVSRVEKCWRIGLDVSPPYEYYRFANVPGSDQGVRLDLVTSLISLYDKYPNLESAGAFDQLQCDLFHGKNEAYYLDDLEAIQRHHTILGLLYARKGMWPPQQNLNCRSASIGGFVVEGRYRDAFFQLENAIKMSERRAARPDGVYQPLAQLKERLAEGNERPDALNPERAARWRVAALEAYLDDDDIEGARRNDTWVRERLLRLAPALRSSVGRLSGILRLRVEAGNPESALVRALERGELPPESLRPLAGAAADSLREGFLERQKFKVLADLAASAERLGPAYQRGARSAAYEAYRVSVDNRVVLMGASDVQRIQHVTNTLAATLGLGGGQSAAGQYVSWSQRQTAEPNAAAGSDLRISLDSKSPILAKLDSRIVLGGEIVKAVGISRWIAADAKLEVSAGQVRVRGVDEGSVNLDPILKAQPNYRSVKVEYGRKGAPEKPPTGNVVPKDTRVVPRKTAKTDPR